MVVSFFIFLVALFIAVPLRIWQYMAQIDIMTGFFKLGINSVYIMAGVFVLAFVLISIFTISDKNTMDFPYRNGTKMAGLSFLGVTLVFLKQYIYSLKMNYIPTLKSGLPLNRKEIFALSGTTILVLSCVVITLILFLGKTQNNAMRIAVLVPVVWSIVKLWQIYMFDNPNVTVSENLMEIFGYFCLAWFLMAFAYCLSGFNKVVHIKQVVVFGFMGSLFLLSNTIGKLIAMIKFNFQFGTLTMDRIYINLAFGLVMLICPLYICFGVDPLLDYSALYEKGTNLDDPIEPKPDMAPIAPAPLVGKSSQELMDSLQVHEFVGDTDPVGLAQVEHYGEELIDFPNNPNYLDLTYEDFGLEDEEYNKKIGTREPLETRRISEQTAVLDPEQIKKRLEQNDNE